METRFTRVEFDLLPEGFPAQLIDGCLVKEASPRYGHQLVAGRIRAVLLGLLGPERVPDTPLDIVLDEHNVYQPDLVVFGDIPSPDSHDVGIPQVAIEVLSPSTAEHDRETKRARLLGAGVAEVWLADPEAGTIEVHDGRAGVRAARGGEIIRSSVLRDFSLVPDRLFRPPQ